MRTIRRGLLCGVILVARPAHAQAPVQEATYPRGPVTMLVPFPPDGPTDLLKRILSQKLQDFWAQPVAIEYKPGAGGAAGVVSGQLPAAVITLAQVRAGKLKALGAVKAARRPSAAHVPAISEQAPGYEMPRASPGFSGPGSMTEAIVAQLNAEFVYALNAPDTRAKLDAAGLPVLTTSVASLRQFPIEHRSLLQVHNDGGDPGRLNIRLT